MISYNKMKLKKNLINKKNKILIIFNKMILIILMIFKIKIISKINFRLQIANNLVLMILHFKGTIILIVNSIQIIKNSLNSTKINKINLIVI